MNLLIDASAWIEYLEGSRIGEKVNSLLKNKINETYVLPITISEVVSIAERKKADVSTAYQTIIKNAKILELTPRIAKEGGIFHARMRKQIPNFGIMDSLLIVTAKEFKAKLVSKDNHFASFKEAMIL